VCVWQWVCAVGSCSCAVLGFLTAWLVGWESVDCPCGRGANR